jgi:hypothetical protein
MLEQLSKPRRRLRGSGAQWSAEALGRAIAQGELAPFYPTLDVDGGEGAVAGAVECPVCFEDYLGDLNGTECCHQPFCTQCFVETQTPDRKKACVWWGGSGTGVLAWERAGRPPDVRQRFARRFAGAHFATGSGFRSA